jgi:hypothetical protein
MARSRNIKQGFFKNDLLAAKPPLTRLLFAGLWPIADREGRLEDRPARIKAECMPYDDFDVDAALADLASGDDPFIVRYQVDGRRYIQVVKWHTHQNPYSREPASAIPADVLLKHDPSTTPTQPEPCLGTGSSEGEGEREGEGEQVLEGGCKGETIDPFEADRDRFTAAWNVAPGVQPISTLSSGRLAQLRRRLDEKVTMGLAARPWLNVLEQVLREKFPLKFTRGDPAGWKPNVDWILKPDSLPAIIEGKYDWEKNDGRRNDIGSGQRHDPATATRPPTVGGF